jgi:cobalt-zinc-cadmium efflux system membrane fusion protein
VHTIAGESVVFVATDEGFTVAHVVIGRDGKSNLEILSGLTAGQKYVAAGGFTIKAELGKDSFGDGHGH